MPRRPPMIDAAIFDAPQREMTAKQAAFVQAYLANGGQATKAAVSAGYSERSAESMASNLIRHPLIQREIMKATAAAIGLSAVPALNTLTRLMTRSRSDYVKLEAARDLLDRAGFSPPKQAVTTDTTLSVTLNLGGSKNPGSVPVTPPDTRKSPAELDADQAIDVDFEEIFSGKQREVAQGEQIGDVEQGAADLSEIPPSEVTDLERFVDFSTSGDVVISTTRDER